MAVLSIAAGTGKQEEMVLPRLRRESRAPTGAEGGGEEGFGIAVERGRREEEGEKRRGRWSRGDGKRDEGEERDDMICPGMRRVSLPGLRFISFRL